MACHDPAAPEMWVRSVYMPDPSAEKAETASVLSVVIGSGYRLGDFASPSMDLAARRLANSVCLRPHYLSILRVHQMLQTHP